MASQIRHPWCTLNPVAALTGKPKETLGLRIETHHKRLVRREGAQTRPTMIDGLNIQVDNSQESIHRHRNIQLICLRITGYRRGFICR